LLASAGLSGILFAQTPRMECYFGTHLPERRRDSDKRLVCFSIPEAGIVFKAPFKGGELHTEYASLLTLLEFVEMNGKIFKGKEIEIFGDNIDLISQVNNKAPCTYEYRELLKKALDYRKKYRYKLGWVPQENNPSTNLLFD